MSTKETIAKRLAEVLRTVAKRHRKALKDRKAAVSELDRDDIVWDLLLHSFATLGGSRGWQGLIDNEDNYSKVAYEALSMCRAKDRLRVIEETLRKAKVRYPGKKAGWLVYNHQRVAKMGGLAAARQRLLSAGGKQGKIKFWKGFKGIGDKYARDMMMDVYHPDFRDSIALDSRVKGISKTLGLKFKDKDYDKHEGFYLRVAKMAGLNGWEVDRLLYNYRDEVLRRYRDAG